MKAELFGQFGEHIVKCKLKFVFKIVTLVPGCDCSWNGKVT